MKLAAAIDLYILLRRATGERFQSPAVALLAFSRRYRNRSLQVITPEDVKQLLNNPRTGRQPGSGNMECCETSSPTGGAVES